MTKQKTKTTPLMQQYFSIKKKFHDTLLFFQVGDFYELFFDDAKVAAQQLAIALTKRGKNNGQDIPLCGVPVHAVNHYLRKLIKNGFKVAMCDQLSKPQPGSVVERGVTNVFTPGTLTDIDMLDDKSASYLLSCYPRDNQCGLIFTELLTAQLFSTNVFIQDKHTITTELSRFLPDEIIVPPTTLGRKLSSLFKKLGYFTSFFSGTEQEQSTDLLVDEQEIPTAWIETKINTISQQKLKQQDPSTTSSLALLYHYLQKTNNKALNNISAINFYQPHDHLIIDQATQKNLEIVTNNNDGGRKNTLLAILDKTKTAMGSRTLKKWLLRPLIQEHAIQQRQDTIAQVVNNLKAMHILEEALNQIADLERIVGRIALDRAQIADYLALRESLSIVPTIKLIISQHLSTQLSQSMYDKISDFSTIAQLLACSLNDDPHQPYTIKKGFNHNLDSLRDLAENGQREILKLEQNETTRTGISSLKIRLNNISGYFIEITKPNLHLVPSDYLHQQTLTNRTRFVTQTLKDLEKKLYKAQNDAALVENQVYETIKQEVSLQLGSLRILAQTLSYLDALLSLSLVAYNNKYTAPTFNNKGNITIKGGRHPVIEEKLSDSFVKNDTILDDQQQLLIITGPNMGGKSTYLRQVALIALMAQCGSFIPADQASLPLLDRIFTRIGAADRLSEGKSTFLVEMEETTIICRQATQKSLVILDEVGRGTSTDDGITLAQAIIEYIMQHVQAKCLFATHYHELTTLENSIPGVKNYNMLCKKVGHTLHFLHTMAPGIAQQSFGLDVAKLANMPEQIIARASDLLKQRHHKKGVVTTSHSESLVKDVFHLKSKISSLESAINQYKSVIDDVDLEQTSPRQALNILWDLKTLKKHNEAS